MKTHFYNSIKSEQYKPLCNKVGVCLLMLVLLTAINSTAFSQKKSSNVFIDSTGWELGQTPIDSNILELPNKIFIFKEYTNGTVIDRIDLKTGEKKTILNVNDETKKTEKDSLKFRGHWAGIEFGINDFLSSDGTMQRPEGYEYLDLRTGNSWNFTFNFAQSTTPIIKDRLAIVGGLGIETSYYRFKDGNNIKRNPTTDIIELRDLNEEYDLRKSKLRTTYLTTPILLEAQFGKGSSKDRFYISGGVIGGLKLTNVIKAVYQLEGKKQKVIERGTDLNINRWRLGLTARIGYKDYFDFYANYYITSFFEKGLNPELHPFALGVRVNF